MIGVIEGGDVMEERLRSARETAKRPVGGFLLDGFQGNPTVTETRLHLLSSVTAELPEYKPRPVLALFYGSLHKILPKLTLSFKILAF